MALNRISNLVFKSKPQPLYYCIRYLHSEKGASVNDHLVNITVVDNSGFRHTIQALEGDTLNTILSQVNFNLH